jgi:hypothetical protein
MDDHGRKGATMDTERVAHYATAFGTVIALVAITVQACQSNSSLNASLNQSNASLKQANQLAWDYQGAQQCKDYRDEVLHLWELGLNQEQIISWLSLETGGSKNPFGDAGNPGGATAYEDRVAGCGSVEQLLKQLPAKPPSPARK